MRGRLKILAAVALVAGAVLLLRMGTTLAGTTGGIVVTNTVQTGEIGIDLRLNSGAERFENMEPGLGVYLDPTVGNIGDHAVYVRVSMVVDATPDLEPERDLLDEMDAQLTEGWLDGGDGFLYYTAALGPGERVSIFRTRQSGQDQPYTMRLPGSWTQDTAPERISIDFAPQAIQAANFAPDFTGGRLWHGEGDA